MITGTVTAVCRSAGHTMRKHLETNIQLLAGLGVEGDAHLGTTTQHLFQMARDPTLPNLRQVHLIHSELHEELGKAGFDVKAGEMGENITTSGLDLLGLPKGTHLLIGESAIVEVTGLRNPCGQLNGIQEGLMRATLGRDADDRPIIKSGIMGIVLSGGIVEPGDTIRVKLPELPHLRLEKV